MGQGANQSIEDAVALAIMLEGIRTAGIPDAVHRYESLRRDRAVQVQRNSRNGGLVYDSGDSPERSRSWRHRGRPSLVLDYDVEAEARNSMATARS